MSSETEALTSETSTKEALAGEAPASKPLMNETVALDLRLNAETNLDLITMVLRHLDKLLEGREHHPNVLALVERGNSARRNIERACEQIRILLSEPAGDNGLRALSQACFLASQALTQAAEFFSNIRDDILQSAFRNCKFGGQLDVLERHCHVLPRQGG